MNARTARLTRRYAKQTGQKLRQVRRDWYKNPWNVRHLLCKAVLETL